MRKEMETRLSEVLQSEIFLTKLSGCDSTEAIRTLLAENGVEVTVDEIEALLDEIRSDIVNEGHNSSDGEMTEESLEKVSGGIYATPIAKIYARLIALWKYRGNLGINPDSVIEKEAFNLSPLGRFINKKKR